MILSALPALSYAQVKNIVTGEYSAVSKIITEKELSIHPIRYYWFLTLIIRY